MDLSVTVSAHYYNCETKETSIRCEVVAAQQLGLPAMIYVQKGKTQPVVVIGVEKGKREEVEFRETEIRVNQLMKIGRTRRCECTHETSKGSFSFPFSSRITFNFPV